MKCPRNADCQFKCSGDILAMVELTTYKYKLYNRSTLKYLDHILVLAAQIYNHCIALHRVYYALYHKKLNKYDLQKHLTKIKNRYPEWDNVPSQSIQDITDRIDRAYRLFFSNLKSKKKTSIPHFQNIAKYKSFTLKQCGYKFHDNNKIKIGKKDFPYWNSRDFNGKVKTLTVKRKSSGYYIYAVVEQEISYNNWPKSGKIVGFDFSLRDFLVSSNGDNCSIPKLLHKNIKSLRNLSKKYRKSKGKRGSLRTLQKLHEKVTNQRTDLHWKMARQFCQKYDVMVFESLDLSNMQKRYKKAIYDYGFDKFLSILEHIAHKTGKQILYADKWYPSTQLCSVCGYQNHALKDVSIRQWSCPQCGSHHDRDKNAAYNLYKVGASTFRNSCPSAATPKI